MLRIALFFVMVLFPIYGLAFDISEAKPSDFDYNYAELYYLDVDDYDDGAMVRGSFDLKPNINLIGGLQIVAHYTEFEFGAGYHVKWDELNHFDFIVFAGLEHGDVEVRTPIGTVNDDDLGAFIGGGVRVSPDANLEFGGHLSHHTVFDGDTVLNLNAAYQATSHLQARLEIDLSDSFAVGVRYYFKPQR